MNKHYKSYKKCPKKNENYHIKFSNSPLDPSSIDVNERKANMADFRLNVTSNSSRTEI